MATVEPDVGRKSRLYAIVQVVLILAFAATYFFAPGPVLAPPAALAVVGAMLCVLGLALVAAGAASLRSALQVAPQPKAGAQLVTSGVYRYLRHPMYTGILMIVVGLVVRRPEAAGAIAGGVVIAFLVLKSRFEERLLLARYPGYADYRHRSWGVVPGSRR